MNQFQQSKLANVSLQLANLTVLKCQKVVRVIPNKRVVCQALWQGSPVYAKLFFGEDAAKYATRDAQGVQRLATANIDTPKLLAQTETQDKTKQVLIFEAIEPALTAEQLWPDLNQNQRQILAKNLVETVAKHHAAGLQQTDLYLKNFLVTDKRIYTLDGDGIKSLFSARQKKHNLATLLSKFDALDDDFMQECVEAYCAAANQKFEQDKFASIYFLAQKIRQETAAHYADKKVFRTCTDVEVTKTANQFFAISKPLSIEHLPQAAAQLDVLIQSNQPLKNGNTCTVALVEIAAKQVVIKRYNNKNFWHGLKLRLFKTRAAKSWANAHRLKLLNITTPKPIMLLEEKIGFFGKKSYFLAEFLDAPDIAEFFKNEKDNQLKQSVAYEVARLFYKLSLLNIVHGDCKASNIKIKDGKPVLLDLDSLFVSKNSLKFNSQHVKDLKRLMYNWQNDAETTALLTYAFSLGYEGDDVFTNATALVRAGIL